MGIGKEKTEPFSKRSHNSGLCEPVFEYLSSPQSPMMIDLLVAKDEEVERIVQNAVKAESSEGIVMLADKKDLIWLKKLRDSKQDQADIERLEDDPDR